MAFPPVPGDSPALTAKATSISASPRMTREQWSSATGRRFCAPSVPSPAHAAGKARSPTASGLRRPSLPRAQSRGVADPYLPKPRAKSRGKQDRNPLWPIITLRQIHSDLIHCVDSIPEEPLFGDGLITSTPGLLLAVQTADCLPVILVDAKRRAVGVFHAGWRGTVKHLVEKGVGEMLRCFGSRPHDLKAAIGPGNSGLLLRSRRRGGH
jgi:hypothetical protein